MELESAKAELAKAQVTLLRAATVVESQEITPAQRTLPKLVDSALLLALGGAFAWVGGFFYYLGFYRRFGLSVYSLSMESPNRLFLPFIPIVSIMVCLLMISFIFTQIFGPRISSRYPGLTAWIYNFPLWFICGVFMVWLFIRADREWPESGLFLVMAIILSITASILKVNLFEISNKRSSAGIFTIIIIIFVIITSASEIGHSAAEEGIEGTSPYFRTVELVMKNTSSLLDGRSLVLIEIIGNQYYLVEVSDPAPEVPRLHIVPASEIESLSTILEDDQLHPGSPSATPIP